MRSSMQSRRSWARRAPSSPANGSLNSASASPRQSARASPSRRAAARGSPPASATGPRVAQALEPDEIDVVGVDDERVPAGPRDEHTGRQHLAELGDVYLHHLRGRVGDILAPEALDEALDGDRAIGMERPFGRAARVACGRRAAPVRIRRGPRTGRGGASPWRWPAMLRRGPRADRAASHTSDREPPRLPAQATPASISSFQISAWSTTSTSSFSALASLLAPTSAP